MTTGQKIKAIRMQKGLTQKELSQKLATSQQNLAQYENDKRKPKYETLYKIARALDVRVSDLINPEDPGEVAELVKGLADESRSFNITEQVGEVFNTLERAAIEGMEAVREELLLSHYEKLNLKGKTEAVKRVEELTHLEKYTMEKT